MNEFSRQPDLYYAPLTFLTSMFWVWASIFRFSGRLRYCKGACGQASAWISLRWLFDSAFCPKKLLTKTPEHDTIMSHLRGDDEMVDVGDLKSPGWKAVRVRVPLAPPPVFDYWNITQSGRPPKVGFFVWNSLNVNIKKRLKIRQIALSQIVFFCYIYTSNITI